MDQIYIYIQVKLSENSIRFQIGIQLESNFASRVPSNLNFKFFVLSELIQCKNWISIKV